MDYQEARSIVENAEIINPGTEHSFVKGCYGNKYRDAVEVLAFEHKNDPCPSELTETSILEHDGFKCKVFYNYVPMYNLGSGPINCWWGLVDGSGYYWTMPLREEIKTLQEACDVIYPNFVAAVKRVKKTEQVNM